MSEQGSNAEVPGGAAAEAVAKRARSRQVRDKGLVEAARAGDRTAFGKVYDEWVDNVYDRAVNAGASAAEAREITEQTFVTAWRDLEKLKQPAAIGAKILQVTRRETAQRVTAGSRPAAPQPRGGASTPAEERLSRATNAEATAADPEVAAVLREASYALDDRTREVLDLHFRQGLTRNETAAVLGEQPDKVTETVTKLPPALAVLTRARVLWRGGSPEDPALVEQLKTDGVRTFNAAAVRSINKFAKDNDRARARSLIGIPPIELYAAIPLADAPAGLKTAVATVLVTEGVPMDGSAFVKRDDKGQIVDQPKRVSKTRDVGAATGPVTESSSVRPGIDDKRPTIDKKKAAAVAAAALAAERAVEATAAAAPAKVTGKTDEKMPSRRDRKAADKAAAEQVAADKVAAAKVASDKAAADKVAADKVAAEKLAADKAAADKAAADKVVADKVAAEKLAADKAAADKVASDKAAAEKAAAEKVAADKAAADKAAADKVAADKAAADQAAADSAAEKAAVAKVAAEKAAADTAAAEKAAGQSSGDSSSTIKKAGAAAVVAGAAAGLAGAAAADAKADEAKAGDAKADDAKAGDAKAGDAKAGDATSAGVAGAAGATAGAAAAKGTAKDEAATSGSATSGSATSGSGTSGSTKAGSTKAGSATSGSATSGSTKAGSAKAGSATSGSAKTGGAAAAGAAAAGAASKGKAAGAGNDRATTSQSRVPAGAAHVTDDEADGSKKGMLIGAGVAAGIVLLLLVGFLVTRGGDDKKDSNVNAGPGGTTTTTAKPATTTTAAVTTTTGAGPTTTAAAPTTAAPTTAVVTPTTSGGANPTPTSPPTTPAPTVAPTTPPTTTQAATLAANIAITESAIKSGYKTNPGVVLSWSASGSGSYTVLVQQSLAPAGAKPFQSSQVVGSANICPGDRALTSQGEVCNNAPSGEYQFKITVHPADNSGDKVVAVPLMIN